MAEAWRDHRSGGLSADAGQAFRGLKGGGATLNGTPIRTSQQMDLSQTEVLAAKPALMAQHWKAQTAPTFKRSYRPSLAYRLALVAEGRFDAMITLRPSWEWDIAAGALIVAEAGGICSDHHRGTLAVQQRRSAFEWRGGGRPPTVRPR